MKTALALLNGETPDCSQIDWYEFSGFCDFHRIAGYLADKLPAGVPPQVRRHFDLQRACQALRQQTLSDAAAEIEKALTEKGLSHAFLKGSALCGECYAAGERDSNDVDLLILPEDAGGAGKTLEALGYVQGRVEAGEIVPFSRAEIVSRRMNRGETAPYVRRAETALAPFVEIDLNFSPDELPASDPRVVREFLSRSRPNARGLTVLSDVDSLIFLCTHLYKEATVLSMVRRYKDLELYKYLDLSKLIPRVDSDAFRERVGALGLEKPCEYALYHAGLLFPQLGISCEVPEDVKEVRDPADGGKVYEWRMDFSERLSDTGRLRALRPRSECAAWQETLLRKIGRSL